MISSAAADPFPTLSFAAPVVVCVGVAPFLATASAANNVRTVLVTRKTQQYRPSYLQDAPISVWKAACGRWGFGGSCGDQSTEKALRVGVGGLAERDGGKVGDSEGRGGFAHEETSQSTYHVCEFPILILWSILDSMRVARRPREPAVGQISNAPLCTLRWASIFLCPLRRSIDARFAIGSVLELLNPVSFPSALPLFFLGSGSCAKEVGHT